MKIGIVTFHSAHNYGAALQVWALQHYLENCGHEVMIINYHPKAIDNVYRLYRPKNIFAFQKLNKPIHAVQSLNVKLFKAHKIKKKNCFEQFANEYMNLTEPFYDKNELQNKVFDFDVLITGSDQVWNTRITGSLDDIFFLNFGSDRMKRISYAASIGMEEFDPAIEEKIKVLLKQLDAISVREEKAKKAVEKLVDLSVTKVVDPTLLLSRKEYEPLKLNCGFKGEFVYVHNVHLERVDDRLNEVAEKISEKTGLPVVYNNDNYRYTKQIGTFNNGGPREFLDIISKARYVVTNSFHATIFSIIFQKDFITVPHFSTPDRMVFLLSELDLEKHLISSAEKIPDKLEDLSINFKQVEKKININKERSLEFLNAAVNGENHSIPEEYAGYKVYEGYLKSKSELMTVSSGGIATAISKRFVEDGGLVVGVRYTNDFKGAQYTVAHTVEELEALKGSKYIEVNKYLEYNGQRVLVYQLVADFLREGRKILFFGLGCDVVALKGCCEKNKIDMSLLYSIDLICHGPTYPEVQKQFLEDLEHKYKSNIIGFSVRDKENGWETPYIRAEFASGKVYRERFSETAFGRAFAVYIRQACYNCKCRENNRKSDLTVGDYWKPYKGSVYFNPNGESVIFSNSLKGELLLSRLDECNFFLKETDARRVLFGNKNYYMLPQKHMKYDEYKEVFNEKGLAAADFFLTSIYRVSRVKKFAKRVIKKLFSSEIINKLKKSLE